MLTRIRKESKREARGFLLRGSILILLPAAALVLADARAHIAPTRQVAAQNLGVKVYFKSWSCSDKGWDSVCDSPDWGWDSVTVRFREGDPLGNESLRGQFLLGGIISPDSAWLICRHVAMEPSYRNVNFDASTVWDSVIITPEALGFGTIPDHMSYRINTIPIWPESSPRPKRTTTILGRVIDDSTGLATLTPARIIVLETSLASRTDRLGAFKIDHVPVGASVLQVCAWPYRSERVQIRATVNPIVIRLHRQ